jgi:hypothetical protein
MYIGNTGSTHSKKRGKRRDEIITAPKKGGTYITPTCG